MRLREARQKRPRRVKRGTTVEESQKSNDGQKKSVKREVTERVCVCVCARETEGNKGGRQRRKREIVCVCVCVCAREREHTRLSERVCVIVGLFCRMSSLF